VIPGTLAMGEDTVILHKPFHINELQNAIAGALER
jgi:hypothetical protein